MKKLFIMVEGQTEERFAKDILTDYFFQNDIIAQPIIVTTKIVNDGTNFRGGWVSYSNTKRDILKLLSDSSVYKVTTMLDYYGLPSDFPEWDRNSDCYKSVSSAEAAFYSDVNHAKFLPYLQLHEFEGIIFSSPEAIVNTLGGGKQAKLLEVKKHLEHYHSPEEINHGPETHPSKRLIKMFKDYNKPLHGSLIAQRTGLDQILKKCPHFKNWIDSIIQ